MRSRKLSHTQTSVPCGTLNYIPYDFQDKAWTISLRSRSLQEDQWSNQGQIMTLYTYIPQLKFLSSINFLYLHVSMLYPG